MRRTEYILRKDWNTLLDKLDGDTQAQLRADLEQWTGGETCHRIQYTVDSAGRLDSQSSPRPNG